MMRHPVYGAKQEVKGAEKQGCKVSLKDLGLSLSEFQNG